MPISLTIDREEESKKCLSIFYLEIQKRGREALWRGIFTHFDGRRTTAEPVRYEVTVSGDGKPPFCFLSTFTFRSTFGLFSTRRPSSGFLSDSVIRCVVSTCPGSRSPGRKAETVFAFLGLYCGTSKYKSKHTVTQRFSESLQCPFDPRDAS
jgi:hypothetical protein